MEDAVKGNESYRVSEAVTEGKELFEAAVNTGLEGVMAKERDSVYRPGTRSAQWLKIKKRRTMDCVIIGYTKGKGGRAASFGALHLAVPEGDDLRYVGKVGTGFDERSMKDIFDRVKGIKRTKRAVRKKPPDDAQSVWIEPGVMCEVQYSSLTKDGMLREPVFLRLRPDRDA